MIDKNPLKQFSSESQLLLESSNESFLLLNDLNVIVFANQNACNVLKLNNNEIQNKKMEEIGFSKLEFENKKMHDLVFKNKVHKTNKRFEIKQINLTSVFNKIFSVLFLKDISNDRIIENIKKFQLLVENSSEIVVTFDIEKRIKYLNPSGMACFGFVSDSYHNQSFLNFLETEFKEYFLSQTNLASQNPGFPSKVEFSIQSITEKKVWLEGYVNDLNHIENLNVFVLNLKDISGQKQAEQNFIQSKRSLDYLINHTEELFILLDKSLKIISLNKEANNKFQFLFNKEVKIGTSIFDYADSSRIEMLKILYQRVLAGEKMESELNIPKENDTVIIQIKYKPIFNNLNQIDGVGIYAQDVTEKRKIQIEVEEAELFYRMVLKTSIDSVIIINDESEIQYINDSFLNTFGFKDIDLVKGQPLSIIQPENNVNAHFNGLKRYLKTKEKKINWQSIEVLAKHQKGHLFPIEISFNELTLKNKHFFIGVLKDITERKEREKALQIAHQELEKSNNEKQKILDNSLDLIITVNKDRQFVKINKAVERILGYTEVELIGKTVYNLLYKDDYEKTLNKSKKVNQGYSVSNFENRYVHKNGSLVHLQWSASFSEKDQLVYAVARDVTSVVAYKERLVTLGQKLNNVIENLDYGLFTINRNWILTSFNQVAKSDVGVENDDELLNRNFLKIFPKAKELKFYEQYLKAFNENVPVKFEEFYAPIHKWFEIEAYPLNDELMVFSKNITLKKQQDLLLSLEKETLELNSLQLVDVHTQVDFILKGLEKIFYGMNCTLLGINNAEKTVYTISSPSLNDDFTSKINGLTYGPETGSCGTAAYLKSNVLVDDIDNSPYWKNYKQLVEPYGFKSCWSFPIIGSSKAVDAVFGIYFKENKLPSEFELNSIERIAKIMSLIFENDKAQKEIAMANERYKAASMATQDAIWDYNLLTKEVYWGEGFWRTFNIKPKSEKENLDLWETLIFTEDKERVLESLNQAINSSNNFWTDEYRFKNGKGNYVFVADSGMIIRDLTGKPTRMIGAMQDITERKKNELMLIDLNKTLEKKANELFNSNIELERFAYVASHDLQEPLRMVSSFLQLLQKKYKNELDETANKYIHFAVDGADRMKKLILDLLEYSKVGSNNDKFELIDLNETVDQVIKNYKLSIDENKAKITVDKLPKIYGLKVQMMQLFQNLISNALKYKHPRRNPEIIIKCEESKNQYQFSISDNGIGIDPKYYQKVFVIFQRLHNSSQYSGTGIGLAICKKIIEKHQGEIWLESENGVGSTFFFVLNKDNIF